MGPRAVSAAAVPRSDRRHRRWLARAAADWAVVLPFALAIAILLIGPAIYLIADSFGSRAGGATLKNWDDVFALALTRRAILSSILLGVLVATLSTAIGAPLAWCV